MPRNLDRVERLLTGEVHQDVRLTAKRGTNRVMLTGSDRQRDYGIQADRQHLKRLEKGDSGQLYTVLTGVDGQNDNFPLFVLCVEKFVTRPSTPYTPYTRSGERR